MSITPVEHEPDRFWVSSETDPDGPPHLVDKAWENGWGCSCQDFMCRERECKHIRAAKTWLNTHPHPTPKLLPCK